jgi:hypothetical protein
VLEKEEAEGDGTCGVQHDVVPYPIAFPSLVKCCYQSLPGLLPLVGANDQTGNDSTTPHIVQLVSKQSF